LLAALISVVLIRLSPAVQSNQESSPESSPKSSFYRYPHSDSLTSHRCENMHTLHFSLSNYSSSFSGCHKNN